MKLNDKQLGKPGVLYTGTKTAIEALTGLDEGSYAYASDTDEDGIFNGSSWTWGRGGAGGGDVFGSASVTDGHLTVFDVDGYHIKDGGVVPTGTVVGNGVVTDGHLAIFDTDAQHIKDGGAPASGGDVTGPAGATGDHLAVFNGVTGKIIKDGGAVPAGGGNVSDIGATTANHLAVWNGASDHIIKDGGVPSAGTVITNGAITDGHLAVFATDTAHIKDGGAVPASSPVDGWVASGQAWTYETGDDPTYTFSEPIDATAKYSPGMRLKCTQGGSVKYGIVTGVGSYSIGKTIITAYWGTDYDLGATITNPYYSTAKAPLGFPLSPAMWTILVTDSTQRNQAPPTQNVWYNLGSFTISIPIGVWRVFYRILFQAYTEASITTQATLSTANNSESSNLWSSYNQTSGTSMATPAQVEGLLTLTSKTSYYLNERVRQTGVDSLDVLNDVITGQIQAICAYL